MWTLVKCILLLGTACCCFGDNSRVKRQLELENRTFIVTTIEHQPYMMPTDKRTKRNEYAGFCKDLLDELATSLGFKYEIRMVRDGMYGRKDAEEGWTGMVGELIDGKADMALAPLTITGIRETAIDFTKPFLTVDLEVMIKKSTQYDYRSWCKFLQPLNGHVWLCLIALVLLSAGTLFLVTRISPCEETPLTVGGSLWYILSTFVFRGSSEQPQALSTRFISVVWWSFSILVILLYGSGLSRLYSATPIPTALDDVRDLIERPDISIGCVAGGSTMQYLKTSQVPFHQILNDRMEANPDVYVNSYLEGFNRVEASNGDYGLIVENPSLDYLMSKECTITKVPGKLRTAGYGIGLPQGSPIKRLLDREIQRMIEDSTIEKLYYKWFKAENKCARNTETGASIDFYHFAAPFVFMLVALVIGVGIAFAEKLMHKRKRGKSSNHA